MVGTGRVWWVRAAGTMEEQQIAVGGVRGEFCESKWLCGLCKCG